MKDLLKRFIKEEDGLETIEWTLMAALIALGFAVLYTPVREAIRQVFTDVTTKLNERPT